MRARRHQATHHGPIHSASNNVAERTIGALTNAVRAMLHDQSSFAEISPFCTASNVRNRTPTKALDRHTPYEMLYNMKLDLADFRTFGAYVPLSTRGDEENG